MAGGEGSRLWPASTPEIPKPFLRLTGDKSLFQQTLERFAHGPEDLYAPAAVICAGRTLGLVRDQAAAIGVALGPVVAETDAGGTALCAALAAALAAEKGPDSLALIVPSDHRVEDLAAFHAAIRVGATAAEAGRIVVFGAPADAPATGYGYLRPGEPLGAARTLDGFVEKPNADRAAGLVADGWLWNAGLFLGSAAALTAALRRHAPDCLAAARAALADSVASNDAAVLGHPGHDLEPTSFDRAVMEKTRLGAVVRLDCGWSDLGAWEAAWEHGTRDAAGNLVWGDVRLEQASGCLVRAEGTSVRVRGLSDVIVVATAAGVLVRPRV